ncbi:MULTISPECIES: DNA polymerase III subunit delta' [unclassified Apibacter]|uniref:DNA polymerase III subunit n=1 Tax=unclassified Apibacter TaxID=2630820 RepID=UPI00132748A7|nr:MULTISPECIES: DNA polymerase III subunit delta' [unclassified Apibacter]MCX8676831.1 DNA polymerase III subunit delta' [Apibacter sp. B3919]MXO24787.1 DNA polymerase III subunit delta' [Apibacter sp. B3924]MXO26031.1 DNA polymerase III subunit delta' [Apibacter sp. B3813]MXO27982.1 DNA polymerase III subunit delta' [Apibacter sp. B3913]MXO29658.1 DNA polymerase III subunit delta' [Apibacter sp. B3912]
MKWDEIIGQQNLKKQLQNSIKEDRISHAQLYIGKPGYGVLPLALAYASEVICKQSEKCLLQINRLQHPDLHLSFPTINNTTEKKEAISSDYIKQFREFIIEDPYRDINQWYAYINEDKKQGIISVKEIENIIDNLNLKSFEGGYKVQIIWMVETMRVEAANKLLKILEEPPAKTLFILIAEDDKKILPTILSRCQKITVNALENNEISDHLQNRFSLDKETADILAKRADGDWDVACKLIKNNTLQEEFEKYFIRWNRAAVMAPKKPQFLREIVDWSLEISAWGREKQKNFLQFCAETFRQALLQNYESSSLVNNPLTYENFKWDNFSHFVHGKNIEDILEEINNAFFHIERNGSAKIIFLDMGIKLTRFLARKNE